LSLRGGTAWEQFSFQVLVDAQTLLANPSFEKLDDPNTWLAEGASLWETGVLADGSWEIDDLPAGVPLQVELLGAGGELRRHEEAHALAPGEERVLDWELGTGLNLRGRAGLAGSGEPYGGQRLWLVAEDAEQGRGAGLMKPHWKPTAETRTDQDGHFEFPFEFTDMEAGRWLVGPAPEYLYDEQSAAPLAKAVEIAVGGPDVYFILEVHRGLYIRGTVKDPEGRPAGESWIFGDQSRSSMDTLSDDQGVFSLGPLAPGQYSLRAQGTGSAGHADSNTVMVDAGAEGVVLGLRPGGAISGMVVDAESGERRQAFLSLFSEDGEYATHQWTDASGGIDLEALAIGSYGIMASTEHLAGLVRDVFVSAGTTVENVVISLERAAPLRICYEGQLDDIGFVILLGGVSVERGTLESGNAQEFVLPPGEATVRFGEWRGEESVTLGERTVTLIVGEKTQVVWPDPKDKK